MRTVYLAGIVIAATAFLNACTSDEAPTVKVPAPAVTTTTTLKSTNPNAKAVDSNAAKKPPIFNTAFIPGKGNSSLIEPTDKNKRQEELIKKNSPQINQARDPFSPIPGTVAPLSLPQNKPRVPVVNLPPSIVRVNNTKPVYVPPDPAEAMAVAVSGVVEIGGNQYAILSIPGEATTRYVRAGQRIANNQVLVKRIDTFGTPSVVLQQYGIEVVRSVGQVVAAAPTTSSEAPNNTTNPVTAPPPNTTNPNQNSSGGAPNTITPPSTIVPPAGVIIPGLPQLK